MRLITLTAKYCTLHTFRSIISHTVQYSSRRFVFDSLALLRYTCIENSTIFGKTTAGLYIVWIWFVLYTNCNFVKIQRDIITNIHTFSLTYSMVQIPC